MSSPVAPSDPFGLTADPEGYVPRPATEEALAALVATLREGRRPAALLGPPGLGKTLLLHLVGRRLDDRLRSVYLPYAALPLDELCAWALSLLGVSQSNDTIRDLVQTGAELRARGSGLLLMVDDAGAMPLPTARKLGDLLAVSGGALRLLLAAAEGPSASRMLAATGANVHVVRLLEPMSEEETRKYVAARLARARIPDAVAARFDSAVLERIHRLSAGIPRRVHGVATAVLRGGAAAEGFDEEELARSTAADLGPIPDALPVPEEALPLAEEEIEPELEPELELPPWAAAARGEARADAAPRARAVFATALLIGGLALSLSAMRAWLEPRAPSVDAPAESTPPAVAAIAPPPPALEEPGPQPSVTAEPTAPESPEVEAPAPPEPVETPAAAVEIPTIEIPAVEIPVVAAETPTPAAETPAPAAETPAPAAETPAPAAETPVATIDPRYRTVSVQVNARPWALIQVDGVDLGATPISGIPLLAGRHRFRARMPDGRIVEREVEVSESNRFVVFE